MNFKFLQQCLIFWLCSSLFLHYFCVEASKTGSQSAVKTIETEDGDVYDCVDFYKQPAFDHPLLKNHSFHPEMRPSWMPKREEKSEENDIMELDIKFKDGSCPRGTVPIRKYNQTLLTNKFFQRRYDQLGPNSVMDQDGDRTYYAIAQSKVDPTVSFYGVGATLSVFNPQVAPNQYSSGEVIIKGDSDAIIMGWTVNPGVYKDQQTRFFIYTVAGESHCFNSECGFILVRPDVTLDFPLKPISKMGGPIYVYKYLVYQDKANGNWWLCIGKNETVVGFWPQRIFQGLYDGGNYVACGGEVFRPANTHRVAMGTGYYPKSEATDYSAYCHKMEVVDKQNNLVYADGYTDNFSSDITLYDAGKLDNHYFIYGGPEGY